MKGKSVIFSKSDYCDDEKKCIGLRAGTKVYVQGDESVGIPSWEGTILKSEPTGGKTYLVRDSSGVSDEVDARFITPKRDIDKMDRERYKDYKKDQKEYVKSLSKVTNHSLDCDCDNHLDADTSFDCSCMLKGSNPEGKRMEEKKVEFDVISLKRGRQLDLDM